MNFNILTILIALFLFTLLIYSLVVSCDSNKEGWVDYKQYPFGNIQSGAGDKDVRPISFYDYPIYRKPLDWPVCNLVDYPIPHCRSKSL
jgi:hypothetical protein